MYRWTFVFASTLYVSATLVGPPAGLAAPKNIVLIMADDMGYECVGAHGCTSYRTPHIDRLAAEGMRFTHCYSQPLCTPSRVQLMTGKYNFRNYEKFEYLNPNEVTFGKLLQDAGYETLIAGKWQLNGTYSKKKDHGDSQRPLHFGFDHTCLWHVTGRPERYKNPVLERQGEKLPAQIGGYGPDVIVNFICDFLRHDHQKPFLVYYPMILPHAPFVPTPDSEHWESGPQKNQKQRYYGEMVAYVDNLVGRVVAEVRKNELDKHTLVLFTTDNGSPGGIRTETVDGVVMGGKSHPTNAGTHVPLIGWQPGTVPAGKVNNDLVDFSDFLPTMMSAAGKELPPNFVTDGRSFLPQLTGEQGNPREVVTCWYDPRHGGADKNRDCFVRNQRFKLYHDGRLFDLSVDDAEENDLRESTNTEVRAARQLLETHLQKLPQWKSL